MRYLISIQTNSYLLKIYDITAKANRTLGLLRRNIRTPSPQLKERAYKALVRPQLEYASVADLGGVPRVPWNPPFGFSDDRRLWKPGL